MADPCDQKQWFSEQIKANMDSLYSVAMRLTGNSSDAEELVAESVTKAWTSLGSLSDQKSFRPWIFRILHNRFISDYRKRSIRPIECCFDEAPAADEQRSRREEISDMLIGESNEFLHWWANPENTFTNQLLGEDIIQALDKLPDAFRITVILINVEGMSYDEAAETLDVPSGTIRSRMKRGRTLLQKLLWQHGRDTGLIAEDDTSERHPDEATCKKKS